MFRTLKNNMNFHWQNFLAESKRIFSIYFDDRDIEKIRLDYFSHKWISREELIRLIDYEEQQFIEQYSKIQKDYHDLLSSFNLNALSNYELLERKMQGTLKK